MQDGNDQSESNNYRPGARHGASASERLNNDVSPLFGLPRERVTCLASNPMEALPFWCGKGLLMSTRAELIRGCCRLSDNKMMRNHLALHRTGRLEQQVHGVLSKVLDRLADGRKRRPDDFRHRRVVEPVTEIAEGISSPARCNASIAPAAMSSLAQASAVIWLLSRSNFSAASTPDLNVKSPVRSPRLAALRLAPRNASRKPS